MKNSLTDPDRFFSELFAREVNLKRAHIILAILLVLALLPLASADMGPKGAMQFNLIYETSESVTLIDSRLVRYTDEQCLNETKLYRFERFECAQNECRAGVETAKYDRLIINFSDLQRQSNVFSIIGYGAEFDVHVTDSELIVEETTPRSVVVFYKMPEFALFFALNMMLELIIALIFIAVLNKSMKVIAAVLIANLISFPALWQILACDIEFTIFMTLESFIVLFEGIFIYYFMKKTIPISQSLALSLIMNPCSFFAGLILWLGLEWKLVQFLSILLVVIILFTISYTYLEKRSKARSMRVLAISFAVLVCAVTGLLVMDRITGGPLLSTHKLSCEPEYYANITAEELREFPDLADAITQGKFIEMSSGEEDRLLDHIREKQSAQQTSSSSSKKLYVRVKGEYYEVRTTRI